MKVVSYLLWRFAVVLAMTLELSGCGRAESYRYKLTLTVSTPEGIKRGSSVVEISFWEVSVPAKGIMHKMRGDALYLDLGPSARPLVALLTRQSRSGSRDDRNWSLDGGPGIPYISRLYGIVPSTNVMDTIAQIARMRGPRQIASNELPDLVTFANVNDPKTVLEVNPNDLQAVLGPHVRWDEITLEITDEPVTGGIQFRLPWLPAYSGKTLDGEPYQYKNTLANRLSTANFHEGDTLKKDK